MAISVSCKSPSAATVADAAPSASASVGEEEKDAGPPMAATRCKAGTASATIVEGEIEVGHVVATKDGFAIGLLRKTSDGTFGSVARVSRDLAKVTVVDVGPPYGDAPPPQPIAIGEALYAAFYARPSKPPKPLQGQQTRLADTRTLSLFDVRGEAAAPATELVQQKDESLAFDLVAGAKTGAMAAWDEDALGLDKGVVKVATLAAGDKPAFGEAHAVSGIATDADSPRVLPRASGGFWVVWVASRPEVVVASDAGRVPNVPGVGKSRREQAALEGPGATPTFQWLEAIAVDEKGAPQGKVLRLTATTGHVSTFELAAAGDAVDVIARDDDQPTDGAGARLVRVRVGEKIDQPIAIVPDGVGDAAPDLLAGPPSWLAWSDLADHARLLPLDDAHVPTAPQSLEPALDAARVLAALPDGLLAILPEEPRGQLRLFSCTR